MLKEAIIFTIGCSILVTNAILSFLPYLNLGVTLPQGVIYVEAGLSVLSCTLFLFGSVSSFYEAVRWDRACWFTGNVDLNPIDAATELRADDVEMAATAPSKPPQPQNQTSWLLLPTAKELCHYGIAGCTIFLSSSLIFCCCSIISLVMVAKDGGVARWIRYPQLAGSIGFVVASIVLMLKAQNRWYIPAFYRVSWHVNFWNMVGSAGFIICSIYGLIGNVPFAQYQFTLSYLWGSCTFLVASTIQFWKAQHKFKDTGKMTIEKG